MEELQGLLDIEGEALLDRLDCSVTGTSVRQAWEAERSLLQPLPTMAEPFDIVVTRKVQRDCLVSFRGAATAFRSPESTGASMSGAR